MSSIDDKDQKPLSSEDNVKKVIRSREERRKKILKSSVDRMNRITNYPSVNEIKVNDQDIINTQNINNIEKNNDDNKLKVDKKHDYMNEEDKIEEFWNKNEIQSKIIDISEQQKPNESKSKTNLFHILLVFFLGIITSLDHLLGKSYISTYLIFILISADFIRTRYKVSSIQVLALEFIRNIHHDLLLFIFGYIFSLSIGQFYVK